MFNIGREDFVIDKIENGYRVTRIDVEEDLHTHLKNLSACESVIKHVINKTIPKRVGYYYLTSIIRLATDHVFADKVQSLIDVRKQKSKQMYFNPHKKCR